MELVCAFRTTVAGCPPQETKPGVPSQYVEALPNKALQRVAAKTRRPLDANVGLQEAHVKQLFVSTLARPYAFQSPVPGNEFAAWILSSDRTQTEAERDKIAAELVDSGCRDAVCSGFESSKWDDAVDLAFLDTSPELSPADDKFVMTSSHDEESLRDVAEFFVLNTSFDFFEPAAFVIVAVGDNPEVREAENLVRELLQSNKTMELTR